MTNHRILIAVTFALLLVAACKKSGDGQPAAGASDKPAETNSGGGSAVASGEINNVSDYEARSVALLDKLSAVFVADGKDCDKLATDLNKFMDENKAAMQAEMAYGKAHPDDKQAVDKKVEAKANAFADKVLEPAMAACQSNKGVQEAMAKIPTG
jgi:hypothetical protein